MSTETTKLLMESLIVFVDALEVVAVMLPALGLCLCAALMIREATRMTREAREFRPESATRLTGVLDDKLVPNAGSGPDKRKRISFPETDRLELEFKGI